MKTIRIVRTVALAFALACAAAQAAPLEEMALQPIFDAVVGEVGPSVVAIEVVPKEVAEAEDGETAAGAPPPLGPRTHRGPRPTQGGQPSINLGDGPTTGLIIEPDGHIITSIYRVADAGKDHIIRVTLTDGRVFEAKKLGTDATRGIVLLKIDAEGLPVPRQTPYNDITVGQWALALGKGLGASETELKVGIISALDRIQGRAIQTDAATSPTNYGGPICDIYGRATAILVPLTGQAPAMQQQQPRPRPQRPQTPDPDELFPDQPDPDEDPQTPEPGEPGEEPAEPGEEPVEPGDDGDEPADPQEPLEDPADPKPGDGTPQTPRVQPQPGRPRAPAGADAVGMYDGGIAFAIPLEDIYRQLDAMKEGKTIQRGAIGIRFARDEQLQGAKVEAIAPESPAEKAGLLVDDVIVEVAGKPITNHRHLPHTVGRYNAGDDVALVVTRGEENERVAMTMTLVAPNELKPFPAPEPAPKEDGDKEDGAKENGDGNGNDAEPDTEPEPEPEPAG